jgi:hypothetical protein
MGTPCLAFRLPGRVPYRGTSDIARLCGRGIADDSALVGASAIFPLILGECYRSSPRLIVDLVASWARFLVQTHADGKTASF